MKYQVKVDGKTYEVEVEKVSGASQPLSMSDFGTVAPPSAPNQVSAPNQANTSSFESAPSMSKEEVKSEPEREVKPEVIDIANETSVVGEEIVSPMPGTILKVNVKDGDSVSAGDVVLILEAMKMENEIVAPVDGKVDLKIKQGESVDTDQVLAVIN